MDKNEFSQVRHHLTKTQMQLSQLLGTSAKAVQSFEQGWRSIPVHIERQMLFLLALKRLQGKKTGLCWAKRRCNMNMRRRCSAWELRAGHICWFLTGTMCRGKVQESWQKKMIICRQCEVFQSTFG
jgi:DNA-binding XRE family transcriptional regulator